MSTDELLQHVLSRAYLLQGDRGWIVAFDLPPELASELTAASPTFAKVEQSRRALEALRGGANGLLARAPRELRATATAA